MAGEKDYQKIAAGRITRPSEMAKKKNILIYARQKKGKSNLCATAPDIIIADPERGTTWMTKVDPPIWPINQWEDIADFYGYLRTGDHPYKWAALDGMTRFQAMALDYVRRLSEEKSLDSQPTMVERQHYGKANALLQTMMVNFFNLPNVSIIWTAQERAMEQQSSEADSDVEESVVGYVAALSPAPRSALYSLVDVIGRLYIANYDKPDGTVGRQRRLWLGDHPLYDTGARSEYNLPEYLKNPTIPKLVELLDTGKVTLPQRTAKKG